MEVTGNMGEGERGVVGVESIYKRRQSMLDSQRNSSWFKQHLRENLRELLEEIRSQTTLPKGEFGIQRVADSILKSMVRTDEKDHHWEAENSAPFLIAKAIKQLGKEGHPATFGEYCNKIMGLTNLPKHTVQSSLYRFPWILPTLKRRGRKSDKEAQITPRIKDEGTDKPVPLSLSDLEKSSSEFKVSRIVIQMGDVKITIEGTHPTISTQSK